MVCRGGFFPVALAVAQRHRREAVLFKQRADGGDIEFFRIGQRVEIEHQRHGGESAVFVGLLLPLCRQGGGIVALRLHQKGI